MSDIAERIVLVMATFVEVLLSEPDLGVDLVWLTALELPDPSCEISRSGRDENSCARRSMYSCSALAASDFCFTSDISCCLFARATVRLSPFARSACETDFFRLWLRVVVELGMMAKLKRWPRNRN
jgi:hypothetical protein